MERMRIPQIRVGRVCALVASKHINKKAKSTSGEIWSWAKAL
jgi:hypothetical protein